MNKLAIDFGNSNTVLALRNEQTGTIETLTLPGISRENSFTVPSRIHYETKERFFIGEEAAGDAGTFRWMKRYIGLQSPYTLAVSDGRIDAKQAAADYLNTLLFYASQTFSFDPNDLTFTVPVESFEHYSEWLQSIMRKSGAPHIRLVDEATAAAAAYLGGNFHPGDCFLLFDFGGSTLQAVCAMVTEDTESGHCCTVLGKSGTSIGGMTVDRWLYEDAVKQGETPSNLLLRECEAAKEGLSAFQGEKIGNTFYTRDDLDRLLETHRLGETIRTVLKNAIRQMEDHGHPASELKAVIRVGGSCEIPYVRKTLSDFFEDGTVLEGDPFGAVARGAAAFAGGLRIYDFIQHDYAIRSVDPESGTYRYHPFISRGTPYPTKDAAASMIIKGSFDGQTSLGLAIYELTRDGNTEGCESEVFFEEDGRARIAALSEREKQSEIRFWLNEHVPFFLKADPPAKKSERRFRVRFDIDSNKMLLITADDLLLGTRVFDRVPVIRLN